MIHIIYIYLMINCFIAGVMNTVKTDGYYTKITIICGTIIAIMFGLPMSISVFVYGLFQYKKKQNDIHGTQPTKR